MNTPYSDEFFAKTFRQGKAAAEKLLPLFDDLEFFPDTVVDIGGGAGGWLIPFADRGAEVTLVDQVNPAIQVELDNRVRYLPSNLENEGDVAGIPGSELAICVEVLEHLSAQAASRVLNQVSKSSETVIFSAAWDGQGGEHHINERPMEDWLEEWVNRDFVVADVIRSRMNSLPRYYQTNLVLLTQNRDLAARLVQVGRFISDSNIPDRRTPQEKGIGAILRRLPTSTVTRLARASNKLRR